MPRALPSPIRQGRYGFSPEDMNSKKEEVPDLLGEASNKKNNIHGYCRHRQPALWDFGSEKWRTNAGGSAPDTPTTRYGVGALSVGPPVLVRTRHQRRRRSPSMPPPRPTPPLSIHPGRPLPSAGETHSAHLWPGRSTCPHAVTAAVTSSPDLLPFAASPGPMSSLDLSPSATSPGPASLRLHARARSRLPRTLHSMEACATHWDGSHQRAAGCARPDRWMAHPRRLAPAEGVHRCHRPRSLPAAK